MTTSQTVHPIGIRAVLRTVSSTVNSIVTLFYTDQTTIMSGNLQISSEEETARLAHFSVRLLGSEIIAGSRKLNFKWQ